MQSVKKCIHCNKVYLDLNNNICPYCKKEQTPEEVSNLFDLFNSFNK